MSPLDELRDDELLPIAWLQGLGEWLTPVMQVISFFGREEFFLTVLPILFWCVSPRVGMRIGLVVLVTGGVNALLKLVWGGPRPYWSGDSVKALSTESSFGVPSGHAQVGVVRSGVPVAVPAI